MPTPRQIGIDSAYSYLVDEIIQPSLPENDRAFLAAFFDELLSSNYEHGHRLLLCLAIDLLCGAKDKDSLMQTLIDLRTVKADWEADRSVSFAPEEDLDAVALFALGIGHRGFVRNVSRHQPVKRQQHAHILSLDSYFRRTRVLRTSPYYPRKREALKKNFRRFSRPTRLESGSGYLFLFPADEFARIPSDVRPCDQLLDALGFDLEQEQELSDYVVINIPEDNGYLFYQPCAATAPWGYIKNGTKYKPNPFYLSYYLDDGYGRTFSVSGTAPELRECVCAQVEESNGLWADLLEPPQHRPEVDHTGKVIDAGVDRWHTCQLSS